MASLFVAGTAVVGFPYLVRTVLGLSAEHYGVAESAMGIAAFFAADKCFCPIHHPAGNVLCLPTGVQHFLHLCYLRHTGKDAGKPNG